MLKTLYEEWMEDRIFMETGVKKLSAEGLKSYQLEEIRKTINIAKKSKFYGEKLKKVFKQDIKNLDIWDALEVIQSTNIDCIVGLPIQVFYLAKLKSDDVKYKNLKLKSILLSADYVPRSLCIAVSSAFSCPVFTHYGMTEMGYGGGVECTALNGYHMRDVDLYTEIIDPLTGQNVTEGNYGEVVFTTLKREGMPLIRYKTGDIARFLPKDCSCSDAFKRMDYVCGRSTEYLKLKGGQLLSIGMIDEIMFGIENVLDYRAIISIEEKIVISFHIKSVNTKVLIKFSDIEKHIRQDKYLGLLLDNNNISLEFSGIIDDIEISNGMIKRRFYYEKYKI